MKHAQRTCCKLGNSSRGLGRTRFLFKDKLPILGMLHMEKAPRNGEYRRNEDCEENRDPVPMTGCAPIQCRMKGLIVDVKVALIFDEWEAPIVDEVDDPLKLEGITNMVETMALIEDIVGVAPTKRLGFLVCGGGVTQIVEGVKVLVVSGLMLSVVKDTVEATVEEADPSISRSGAVGPNVGLSESK